MGRGAAKREIEPWRRSKDNRTIHPEPISKAETVQLVIGFIILGGYPFPFLILGRQFALALIALWGLVTFLWTLRKYTCSQCVNFSCFLNTVPRDVVDEYLKRNPVMRKAWEESGWQMGQTGSAEQGNSQTKGSKECKS